MNFLKCSQFKRKLILKWYVIINRQRTSCQNIKIFTLFFMTNETREWWFIFKHQIQCQWTLYAINGATCITSCTIEFIQRVSLNALNDICLYLWQRFSRLLSVTESISKNLSNTIVVTLESRLTRLCLNWVQWKNWLTSNVETNGKSKKLSLCGYSFGIFPI